MTHAEAFRLKGPHTPPDPRPGCPGALVVVGRFWGDDLPRALPCREVCQCRACGVLLGTNGLVAVWVQRPRRRKRKRRRSQPVA